MVTLHGLTTKSCNIQIDCTAFKDVGSLPGQQTDNSIAYWPSAGWKFIEQNHILKLGKI